MPKKYNISKKLSQVVVLSKSVNDNEKPADNLSGPADYEAAISATGFGKYNLLLVIIGVGAGWTSIFETTTMSYVFPAAQCDLNLSLDDKGLLNAVTYLGTISSALIWGFLFDTLGRKKLLMVGYLLDAFFVLMSALSQSKALLMVSKFFGGFIINGPYAAFTTYLSEFHCAKHRPRMQLVLGKIYSLANIVLALLAWSIIPENLSFSIFDNSLEFHSWNIFLLICGLPSLISGIVFIFMPESPKFLMTIGQNEKALVIFRKIYSVNTGKPIDSYPVKELVDEIKLKENDQNKHGGQVTANRTKTQALREGWQQIRPLFFPPHLVNIILVCTIQTLIMTSLNTLRLWLPQIFQVINDYQYYHNSTNANLCTMLEMVQSTNHTDECVVNLDNSSVYINSTIVGTVMLSGYLLAGSLVNILGKKKLLSLTALISGICAISVYYTTNTFQILTCFSLFVASGSVSAMVTLSIIIDLFPTTLRTMTIALAMMLGRSGSILGNILFPYLLRTGCGPPFFTNGSILIGCAVLALTLPNTDLKALE